MKPIDLRIAEELGVRAQQVAAGIALLDSGATVPFVARYRKEATGALDDTQLRRLEERLRYLRELDERRAVILDSIGQQGKLDPALKQAIDAADSKAQLEDLYLPYREQRPNQSPPCPKRRAKAQIARETGLGPLAGASGEARSKPGAAGSPVCRTETIAAWPKMRWRSSSRSPPPRTRPRP